jgi:inner membrane protein
VPPRSIPRRIAAGFFACAAPDLDFVIGFAGPVEYLLHHRGVTHSLLLAPLWAFPVAWLLARILREPGGWRALYAVCMLAIYAHIAGDWITSFGTMVLAPFSDWRAGIGTTFIIDLWFSGIIIAGLVFSGVLFRSRIPSVVSLAALAGYVGFQYVQKENALEIGRDYANSRGMRDALVTAQPRPVSPFNWTVFVSDARDHHVAHVNLVREVPRSYRPGDGFVARLDSAYQPRALVQWETRSRYGGRDAARAAWESPAFGFFRWFAALPALESSDADDRCHWFVDLRFGSPGRDVMPFRFGVCREDAREDARSALGSAWRAYEFDGETRIALN